MSNNKFTRFEQNKIDDGFQFFLRQIYALIERKKGKLDFDFDSKSPITYAKCLMKEIDDWISEKVLRE